MLPRENVKPIDKPRAITALAIGLVICYPALTLIIAGSVNTIFFCLFIVSIWILVSEKIRAQRDCSHIEPKKNQDSLSKRDQFLYIASMAGLTLAVFTGQVANHRWGWPYYDAISRFLFSIPIFFALRRIKNNYLLLIWYGIATGAFIAVVTAIFFPYNWGDSNGLERIGTSFVNPIHFGDIALTLGILPLFGLETKTTNNDADYAFKLFIAVTAGISGIYASILSGSRGGWVAIPFYIFIALAIGRHSIRPRTIAIIFSGTTALLLFIYFSIPEVRDRLDLIIANLREFASGEVNTSIGIRLQLWKAAIIIFIDHPIFGIGMGGFKATMDSFQQMGILTPLAAEYGRQEVHNEILSRMSQLGVVGLVAIIAIYLVPAWLFWKQLNAKQIDIRRAARMGVALVCGFFVYGLSVETFDLTMTSAFYALTISILLAAAHPKSNRIEKNDV
ncbi:O-antigen ligase [Acidocella sp.]|uniref:O-antigen ligase family protein n=1 Tax=Acidocella sp. TaxID=50710 RepID=UPI00261E12CE|nr:O-antigen ligase [Acidocella sp.]